MERNRKTYIDYSEHRFAQAVPSIMIVMVVVLCSTMSRMILSPLLLEVEQEFQLTHGPSSRLFLIMSIGVSVSLLLSGYVTWLVSYRGTVLLCTLIISGSLIMTSLAANFTQMRITMLLLGIGSGLYPASGLTVLYSLVSQENRQKALSLHEFGPYLGMFIAPLIANFFIGYASWRTTYLFLGLFTLAAGLVFFARVKTGYSHGHKPTLAFMVSLIRNPAFLVLVLFVAIAIGTMQGIYALVPVFLVKEGGLAQDQANYLFSISRLTPLIALVVVGFLQDRIGVRRSLVIALSGIGIFVLLMGLLKGPLMLAAVVLQPALGALLIPASLGVLYQIGPKESQNIMISLLMPIAAIIGSGLIPAFFGYMGDEFTFAAGFVIFGIFILASTFLIRCIKQV